MEQPITAVPELAARTRSARERMARARRAYYARAGTYEEMAEAAQCFCRCFEAYHFAKTGKRKRLDPRAVLR